MEEGYEGWDCGSEIRLRRSRLKILRFVGGELFFLVLVVCGGI